MAALKKLLAVVLAITSLGIAIHFVAGELYGAYLSQPHLVWDYLNWLTAFAVAIAVVYHYLRRRNLGRAHDNQDVSLGYVTTNFLLFASVFLALWFFSNWSAELNEKDDTPGAVIGFVWISFNACFVVLAGVTAWQLWSDEGAVTVAAARDGMAGESGGSDPGEDFAAVTKPFSHTTELSANTIPVNESTASSPVENSPRENGETDQEGTSHRSL